MMSRRGPFSVVTVAGGNAQCLVDAQRLGVAHEHRVQDVGAEVGDVLQSGLERRYSVWRCVPTSPALNSGSALRPTCTQSPEPLSPVMMLVASTVCVAWRMMRRPARAAGCRSSSASACRCAECRSGKMSVIGTSSAIEKTLKPVNTSLPGGRRAPGMPPRSSRFRLTRSKMPFSSSWYGSSNCPAMMRPPLDRVWMKVSTNAWSYRPSFAARRVARVVALERTEAVDQTVGLRAVVVGQHGQIVGRAPSCGAVGSSSTPDRVVLERRMRVTFIVSVPPVSCHSNSLPPPSGSVGLGAASGLSVFLNSTR